MAPRDRKQQSNWPLSIWGGPQADGVGRVGEPLAGSHGRGQAPPLHSDGPTPSACDHPDGPLREDGHLFRTQDPYAPKPSKAGRRNAGRFNPQALKDRSAKSPGASTLRLDPLSFYQSPVRFSRSAGAVEDVGQQEVAEWPGPMFGVDFQSLSRQLLGSSEISTLIHE